MNVYEVQHIKSPMTFDDHCRWYTAESYECVQGCFPNAYIRYIGKAVGVALADIDGHCEIATNFVFTERK